MSTECWNNDRDPCRRSRQNLGTIRSSSLHLRSSEERSTVPSRNSTALSHKSTAPSCNSTALSHKSTALFWKLTARSCKSTEGCLSHSSAGPHAYRPSESQSFHSLSSLDRPANYR